VTSRSTSQTIQTRRSGLLVIETTEGNEMEHLESDLNMASYLLAKGFEFLGLELVGTRYSFKFEDPNGVAVASAIQEYRKGALIPARDFAAAIQQLKGALYAAKYQNRNGNGNDKLSNTGR
jgi:hypothetical protein